MRQQPKRDVIKYLEDDLLISIQADIKDVLVFHSKREPGGIHSIPREVFCYVDFLGSVCYGLWKDKNAKKKQSATTEHAVKFIKEYFTNADPKYDNLGELIYTMWRHGTVHEYDPKVLIHTSQGHLIGWLANKSPGEHNTACHLKCCKLEGSDDKYVMVLNLFELVKHLQFAIKALIRELKNPSNKILLREVQSNFNEISRAVNVDELFSKRSIPIVKAQIEQAVKDQHLIVDRRGEVLNPPCDDSHTS